MAHNPHSGSRNSSIRRCTLRNLIQFSGWGHIVNEHFISNILDAIIDHLAPLHAAGTGHGDLRPETILLEYDVHDDKCHVQSFLQDEARREALAVVRATDQVVNGEQDIAVRSLVYTAPEAIKSGVYTPLTDIYSLGVIAFEMLVGNVPAGPWNWSCQHCAYGWLQDGYNTRREWHPSQALFAPCIFWHEEFSEDIWNGFCYWTTESPQNRLPDLEAVRRCLHEGYPPLPFVIGGPTWIIGEDEDEEEDDDATEMVNQRYDIASINFSSDGRKLHAFTNDGLLLTRSTDIDDHLHVSFEVKDNLTHLTQPGDGTAFSPCGRYLYLLQQADPILIHIRDLTQSAGTTTITIPKFAFRTAMFTCDGEGVATISKDNVVQIWDSRTGRRLRQWQHDDTTLTMAAFAPGGRFIVAADEDGRRLFMLSADNDPPTRIHELPCEPKLLDISTDGSMAVVAETRCIRGYRLPDFVLIWEAWHEMKGISNLAFSRNSQRIVTASRDGIRLWDARTGSLYGRLPYLDLLQEVVDLKLSPSGDHLAIATDKKVVSLWGFSDVEETAVSNQKPAETVELSPITNEKKKGKWYRFGL